MRTININETIPVEGTYDVIVAGGGVAGIAAALSAGRAGRKVLIIEKSTMFGGLATLGIINFFVPLCNGRGKQIIKGMCEEFLRMSVKYGYDTLPEDWKDGEPKRPTLSRYITSYSAGIFALTLTEMLKSEGVDILLDSVVSRPVMNGNHCEGLIVENKSGRSFYEAGIVVDTTGDADVLYRAGVPTVQGNNFFTYIGIKIDLDSCGEAYKARNIAMAIRKESGGGATLYGQHHPEGMRLYQGTNAGDVSEYLVLNQLKMLEKLKKSDRKSRDITTLPGMAQFRTTRHIKGGYTLTESDKYAHFEDSISAICDFDNRDNLYEVPFRTLVDRDFDNIITAGRSASAEGYAWDVLRVIPPAIMTGQAAGTAASLCLEDGRAIADTDIKKLQQKLAEGDVMIHFDDSLIPSGNGSGQRADIGHI